MYYADAGSCSFLHYLLDFFRVFYEHSRVFVSFLLVASLTCKDLSDDALRARAAELFSLRNNGAHTDSSSLSPVMVGGVNYHLGSSFGGDASEINGSSSSGGGVMGSWVMGGSGPDCEDENAPLVGGRDSSSSSSSSSGDLGYGGV